jgi:hypothetical protein
MHPNAMLTLLQTAVTGIYRDTRPDTVRWAIQEGCWASHVTTFEASLL